MSSWIQSLANSIAPMYIEWLRLYPLVVEELGIDTTRDNLATYLLRDLLVGYGKAPSRLEELGRVAIVVGAGPSLERVLERIEPLLKRLPTVAADGAARALLEVGVVPKAIASDLDGDLSAIIEACEKGSMLFLHAHGDNIDRLLNSFRELAASCRAIVGTTQIPNPPPPLINLGGFTDGDRACLAAYALGARKLLLLGMDLCSDYVGRYSKGFELRALRPKILKLRIARRVLDSLARRVEIVEIGTKCLTYSRCVGVEEAGSMVFNWVG